MSRYAGPRDFREPLKAFDILRVVAEIEKLFDDLDRGAAPRYERRPEIARTDTTLAFGELVVVDSGGGNVSLTLPAANPRHAGQSCMLVRRSASSAVTVTASGGSVLLDGSTNPLTLTAAVRHFRFVWDGEEWTSG